MNRLDPEQIDKLLEEAPPGTFIYLIGAGGCGMSGLGHLLLDRGHGVAGSDLVRNEEIRQLVARGMRFYQGHRAASIEEINPILVAYSSAIPLQNPEIQAARERQIPIVRRARLLSALLQRQRGICVAGMHGKTTTSALLSFALERLGARPSYAIGALVPQLPAHARYEPAIDSGQTEPTSRWFVIEADESDGSLREFDPEHSILLNIDAEHLDFYSNLESICQEFEQFARKTRGLVVYCGDDPSLREMLQNQECAVSFGYLESVDYRIVPCPAAETPEGPSAFEILYSGRVLGRFTLELLGEKNISNAAAVIALLHRLGYAPEAIAPALSSFRGAWRRQYELFRDDRFRVFEDYGHHPREIQATLSALKSLGGRRLLVVFQPHRYTRTRDLMSQFAGGFRAADRLWLTEVYAAGEPAIPGIDSAALAAAMKAQGQAVDLLVSADALLQEVRAAMQTGDTVLFLGAGDITHTADRLAALLRSERTLSPQALYQVLARRISPETVLRCQEPMSKHTTFRLGGNADFYIEPVSEAELRLVVGFCLTHQVPFRILGRGSNLLVRDGGFRGLILRLAHPYFSQIELRQGRLYCGAGARLKSVVMEARRLGLGGLEFLEGIPGTVGGALRMNAGALGRSIFQVLEKIRFMDYSGQIQELSPARIPHSYRRCDFFGDHIALGAEVNAHAAPLSDIDQKLEDSHQRRWKSQPVGPSAGCVFKNPAGIPAGRLIEELGLKGTRIGGAVISNVHGNFIINESHATARDVLRLIELIRERARADRGIELETEVEIIGEDLPEASSPPSVLMVNAG